MKDEEAREDELYAAYAASIEVPEMWSGIEARLRRRTSRARRMALAAAAAIAVVVLGIVALRRDPLPAIAGPAGEASAQYRVAIARFEGDVRKRAKNDARAAAAAAALPALTEAVRNAEIAASAAPADPVVVTRLMTAYDAKLETLRGAADAR